MSNPLLSAHYLESKRLISEELQRGVEPEYLSSRPGPGGRSVSYIEANRVIDLANRIFGYDGWSSTIINTTEDYFDRDEKGTYSIGIATVMRVVLRSGAYREDVGYGTCIGRQKGEVLEKARKESATDALKRALRLFGNRLGNSLYNKEYVSEAQQDRNTNPIKGSGISHAPQPSARTYAYQPYQPYASPLPSNDYVNMTATSAGTPSTSTFTSTSTSAVSYAPYTPGTGNGNGTGPLQPQLTQLPAPASIPTPVPVHVPAASGAPMASLAPLIVPSTHTLTHPTSNTQHTQHKGVAHTAVSPAIGTYNTRKRQRVDDDRSPDSRENPNSGDTRNSVSENVIPGQTSTPVQTRGYGPVHASTATPTTHSEGLTSTDIIPHQTPTDTSTDVNTTTTTTPTTAGTDAGVLTSAATDNDIVLATAPPARTLAPGVTTTAATRAHTPVAMVTRPASMSAGRVNSFTSSSTPSRSASNPSASPATASSSLSSSAASSASSSASAMSLNARYSAQLAQVPTYTPAPAHTAADAPTAAQATTQLPDTTVTTPLSQALSPASTSTSTSIVAALSATADMAASTVAPTNMTTPATDAPIVADAVMISASISTISTTTTHITAGSADANANVATPPAPVRVAGELSETGIGGVSVIDGVSGVSSMGGVGIVGVTGEEHVSSGDTSLVATQPDNAVSQSTNTGASAGTGAGVSAAASAGTSTSVSMNTGTSTGIKASVQASIVASPARTVTAAPRAQNMYRGRRALYSSAPPANPTPGEGEEAS